MFRTLIIHIDKRISFGEKFIQNFGKTKIMFTQILFINTYNVFLGKRLYKGSLILKNSCSSDLF